MSTINRISFKRGGEWNGYGRGERSTEYSDKKAYSGTKLRSTQYYFIISIQCFDFYLPIRSSWLLIPNLSLLLSIAIVIYIKINYMFIINVYYKILQPLRYKDIL